jgi:hypothetical protein
MYIPVRMAVRVRYPDVGDPEDGESITLEDHLALEDVVNTTPSLAILVRCLERDGVAFIRSEGDGLTIFERLNKEVVFGIGDKMLESGQMAAMLGDVIPQYTQRIAERCPMRHLLALESIALESAESDSMVDDLARELEDL